MPTISSSEAPILVIVHDEFEGGTVRVVQNGNVRVTRAGDLDSIWLAPTEAHDLARALTESLALWNEERSHYTVRYSSNPQEDPNG